jgi:two-component system, chemotaxis family, CheB/CheR fusion protein
MTVFGTDIDANAVAIARTGRYRKETLGLPPERLERWFVRAGDDYCPVPEIRNMCVFSTHSVLKDPPFSRLDLISCRNVLIYLEEELQDRLMRTFHYALLPGGYLFLGTSESVTRNSRLFTALDKKNRILQRRDAGGALPAFRSKDMPAPLLPSPWPRRRPADDRIDKAVARVMQHYAPAYFVIDRNHEITRFSGGETGHYLEPSQGAASLNLFSILHKALRPAVRAAVGQALADGVRIVNDNLTMRIDGEARALTLIVEPIGGEEGAKSGAACVVAFRDTLPATAPPKTPQAGNDANVEALENELRATKAQLEAAIDELETSTEDMKSTTEEFQAVNEELQSSNEELETSKEELQSVNEELQTINSELNNKNEQLTRLNVDMQNLLDSTQIATVFLDDELRIRHFTPALTQLFPVKDSDRGRPLMQIVSDVDCTTLQADVQRVQRGGEVLERDLALKDRSRDFVMRIRPYRTSQNVAAGVVITFVDITERKRAEQQLLFSRELQHRTNNLLAVIQSIAAQSLSGTHSLAEARAAFTARLHALANANALLIGEDWQGASLEDVIARELASFVSRASLKGPPLELTPSATQGFALVIHELATNAAKFGALSTPGGQVAIRWSVEQRGENPRFSFSWQESGGPRVTAPERNGFGTTLLTSALGGEATPHLEYAPQGLHFTLEGPLSAVARERGG